MTLGNRLIRTTRLDLRGATLPPTMSIQPDGVLPNLCDRYEWYAFVVCARTANDEQNATGDAQQVETLMDTTHGHGPTMRLRIVWFVSRLVFYATMVLIGDVV